MFCVWNLCLVGDFLHPLAQKIGTDRSAVPENAGVKCSRQEQNLQIPTVITAVSTDSVECILAHAWRIGLSCSWLCFSCCLQSNEYANDACQNGEWLRNLLVLHRIFFDKKSWCRTHHDTWPGLAWFSFTKNTCLANTAGLPHAGQLPNLVGQVPGKGFAANKHEQTTFDLNHQPRTSQNFKLNYVPLDTFGSSM